MEESIQQQFTILVSLHPNIKAFTLLDKSISLYDELEEAKATANMHNMQHIISNLDADVVLDINNMVWDMKNHFSI